MRLNKMDEKKPKSQSQKIRNILYRIWEQDNEGMDFETFYKHETGKIIEAFMKRLEPPLTEYE